MAPSWLRWFMGSRSHTVDRKILGKYRAQFARYVLVRTFHSNVLHWLTCAQDALDIIAEESVFEPQTSVLLSGRQSLTLEDWFSDNHYHYSPLDSWDRVYTLKQQLEEALDHTPTSTQYYRRQTKGLFDDLVSVEEALRSAAERYDKHQQYLKRGRT